MESEEISEAPKHHFFSKMIKFGKSGVNLHLSILEFENALQAAVYDVSPKLGSMVLGFKIKDIAENQHLFSGKHGDLASVLTMILVKQTSKIVYGSVNLTQIENLSPQIIRELVDEYISSL